MAWPAKQESSDKPSKGRQVPRAMEAQGLRKGAAPQGENLSAQVSQGPQIYFMNQTLPDGPLL